MEAPSVPLQIARAVLPPLVVLAGWRVAFNADLLLSTALFLIGSAVAGWIARSPWCPGILFAVPTIVLIVAVYSEWPMAKEDGVAALVVIFGSAALVTIVVIGTVLASIAAGIARERHYGRHSTSQGMINVGQ